MAAHIGKTFEREIQKVFAGLKTSHLLGYHRLSDTGAAGSVVAAQPSDYLVGFPPGSQVLGDQRLAFLEVKASETHDSLKKAMVRDEQRRAVSFFRNLLGIPYFILFWDSNRGVIQLWDGLAVHGEGRMDQGGLLAQWSGCGAMNKLRHEFVGQCLVEHFKIPPAKVTLSKVR